ncbi:hypothetical protein I4U23_024080 [Adineta vaga]|nr:hypothetical protein I4U23_024080 [Adineta vaga]
MASPIDNFKTSLFGQLKTLGNGVQGAFEQRIARPLIALKRDLARSSSKRRTSSDQDPISSSQQTSFVSHQESSLSSSPLEIIDFQANIDKIQITPKVSDDSSSTRNSLSHHKNVSFVDHNRAEKDIRETIDNLMKTESYKEATNHIDKCTVSNDFESDFHRHFQQMIKPRRISLGNSKDLVYQDLSAEIVGYVLKHALRSIEKEDEEFFLSHCPTVNQQDGDIIDLK